MFTFQNYFIFHNIRSKICRNFKILVFFLCIFQKKKKVLWCLNSFGFSWTVLFLSTWCFDAFFLTCIVALSFYSILNFSFSLLHSSKLIGVWKIWWKQLKYLDFFKFISASYFQKKTKFTFGKISFSYSSFVRSICSLKPQQTLFVPYILCLVYFHFFCF